MVPVPVILCEFLIAFGLALMGANALALIKLRRDGNWPPDPGHAGADGDTAVPSRARILTGIAVGLVVTLWAVATFVSQGYSL